MSTQFLSQKFKNYIIRITAVLVIIMGAFSAYKGTKKLIKGSDAHQCKKSKATFHELLKENDGESEEEKFPNINPENCLH